ncbi:esterase OVCA2 [Halyomorpha halys]|uniref:esterase OVCA2 n=1 Tax=Halyomorpha halys TaxID=286706 RepID=UPI0006D50B2B|nr:esterase OVCA2 [Halyomorpha halys]
MAEKLKILCLHGCRQDGKIFNQKTGSLRRMLKNICEFTYVTAPHSIKPLNKELNNEINNDEYDYRTWWYNGADKSYLSKLQSEIDEGFDESLQFLKQFIRDNGPFDGLLGFSQGGALAALICFLIERKEFDAEFKFVILISAFKSLCTPHLKYYSSKIDVLSLHVFGEGDDIITKDRSEDLMSLFAKAETLRHSGGHYVPSSKEQREPYLKFFKDMLSLKQQIKLKSS